MGLVVEIDAIDVGEEDAALFAESKDVVAVDLAPAEDALFLPLRGIVGEIQARW